jgi:dienelactone hydrolase
MHSLHARCQVLVGFLLLASRLLAEPLPGTALLEKKDDLSAAMVAGIDRWLVAETTRTKEQRTASWRTAAAAAETWTLFAAARREQLRRILGVVDPRASGLIEEVRIAGGPDGMQATGGVQAVSVRWPVFSGVSGEGVLFRPSGAPRGVLVIIPDADQLPEQAPRAAELAAQGWLVLAPLLIDRRSTSSGNESIGRWTNQPHREWLHRPAFEVGRTVIGYEVQKICAAIDALRAANSPFRSAAEKVGLIGHGEGGLLALAATALDERIAAAVISGYFGPRESLADEPLYRNVFGLLRDFGDAELVALAAPRTVIIESAAAPQISGPPVPTSGRQGAAPGVISTPSAAGIASEKARADALLTALQLPLLAVFEPADPGLPMVSQGAPGALLKALKPPQSTTIVDVLAPTVPVPTLEFADARQHRAVRELETFTQSLVPLAEQHRRESFLNKAKPGVEWEGAQRALRDRFWREVIGKIEAPLEPARPQSRLLFEKEKWRAYEVTLDVLPDVFAWGWLLVPRDLQPGERCPVIVCQHGLEGLPEDVVNDDPKSRPYAAYKAFAARLVERGFIVYAPHNPYRGADQFRRLQRRANPLGLSLFSFILAQHDTTTQWLASLPFVDAQRIAFYGLSYGGKTAMRLPALLDRYCLSICSGDFNEWVRKNVSTDFRASYVFTGEWEMPEWNLAAVANYAEMAMLIAPRPFMVERGHDDGVAPDEWVGYEFAKVRRGYTKLGIPERAEIEWFNGPHTIHGVGTFEFLHKHLAWPRPQ